MLIKYACICELKPIIGNNNIDTNALKEDEKISLNTSAWKPNSSDADNEHEWDIIEADFEEYDDAEDYQVIHNNNALSSIINENHINNENNVDIKTSSTTCSNSVDIASAYNNENGKVEHVTRYQAVLSNKYPDIEDNQFELLPSFVFPTNSVLDTLEFHWFVLTDVRLSFIYIYTCMCICLLKINLTNY